MAAKTFTTSLVVTDAAEVPVVAHTQCSAIYLQEQCTAAGYPRTFLVRGIANSISNGSITDSIQNPEPPCTVYKFSGIFNNGDKVGTIELLFRSGDSTTFNQQEMSE